ncbi:hypothetical protein AGABI2DRAFT_137143 [Agaricus bisporus var. bisporus H97]|uniref:hypothetical protein n=1 Tax=Agaricus bisporus var. bisporus (strain H97 / ATCC MYA-4626 / FGSC 10389) TaxID=936046 RepID=UPI00029F7F23|nr:hypothetical protein AGABI2DRAFT_137143 [Agaricus bisporus var. bisporus H97]EKV45638.1 hypothetical protein AGABI2DRAFT_137143 [Agaricus bisporus var. bisporus H97]
MPLRLDSLPSEWTTERITNLVHQRFNKRPCWYQIEAAKAFYAGRDVIGCAPTGGGKTLSFWIPLLMAREDKLKKIEVGISAVAVAAENATSSTFKVIIGGLWSIRFSRGM